METQDDARLFKNIAQWNKVKEFTLMLADTFNRTLGEVTVTDEFIMFTEPRIPSAHTMVWVRGATVRVEMLIGSLLYQRVCRAWAAFVAALVEDETVYAAWKSEASFKDSWAFVREILCGECPRQEPEAESLLSEPFCANVTPKPHLYVSAKAMIAKYKKEGFNGIRFHNCVQPSQEYYIDEQGPLEFAINMRDYALVQLEWDLHPGLGDSDDPYEETVYHDDQFENELEADIKKQLGEDITLNLRSGEFEIFRMTPVEIAQKEEEEARRKRISSMRLWKATDLVRSIFVVRAAGEQEVRDLIAKKIGPARWLSAKDTLVVEPLFDGGSTAEVLAMEVL